MEKGKKTIKVYYYGEMSPEFDKVIEGLFDQIDYKLVGSGYRFDTEARDLEFGIK